MVISWQNNLKAIVLALQSAVGVCVLLGIFWNPPVTFERFDQTHWHYINRGLPKAWAGVSKEGMEIDLPLIRVPHGLVITEDGIRWNKIINFSQLAPFMVLIGFSFYIFWVIWVKAFEGTKWLSGSLWFFMVAQMILGIWTYLFWFIRV
jgi:hypothetical protein